MDDQSTANPGDDRGRRAVADAPTSRLNSLPIVCTLTAGDLQDRLVSIQTLTREALLSYRRNGLELTLRYDPAAVERVRRMVAGERHCCAFLNFDIQEHGDRTVVTITAPDDARDAADELFAQFIASMPRR